MSDHGGCDDVVTRAIFHPEAELRRGDETIDQRVADEGVARLAGDEMDRARLEPVVGAGVEQAMRRGEDAPRRDQRAGAHFPRRNPDHIDAADRGPRPLVGRDADAVILWPEHPAGPADRRGELRIGGAVIGRRNGGDGQNQRHGGG